METLAVVRKVAQDVLIFVCHKQGLIAENPTPDLSFVPEITAEFLRNLSLAVWIDSYSYEFLWEKFFRNHFHRMTASPYRFANYFSYACYTFDKTANDAYESFTGTLSLAIHFVMHCWHKGRTEFLNTCVDLFCDFFELEILSKFQDQGGWQYFNQYLEENHESLNICKDLMGSGESVYVLFKELEMEHLELQSTCEIGGVILKDVTECQVLDDKKAASFADSVSSKIQKLVCKQTVPEVLAHFKKADQRVEELYRQMVGEATGGAENQDSNVPTEEVDIDIKTSEGKQSTLQKDHEVSNKKTSKVEKSPLQKAPEASQNTPKQTSGKKKKQKAPLPAPAFDSPKSRGVEPTIEELGLSPKLTGVEKAKILLRTMLDDIKMVHDLIKFLCIEKPTQTIDAVVNA